jgi:hypothetical protein
MTPATLAALQRFDHAVATLAQLFPETTPADNRDRRTPLTIDAPAWDAIDDALDFLYAIDPRPEPPIYGQPASYCHWLRQAWLEIVRAAASAAGHGDDDAPRWSRMNAAELADELTYLADHQA